MKATDVIRRDHKAAKELFAKFKQVPSEKRDEVAEKIFSALDTHEKMEDKYFYSELEEEMEDDGMFAELEKEQKELAEEVEAAKKLSGADRDMRLKEIMARVLAHAEKEEEEILTKAEETLDAEKLEEMGKKMEPHSAVAMEEKE